jgi:hypothetical protein
MPLILMGYAIRSAVKDSPDVPIDRCVRFDRFTSSFDPFAVAFPFVLATADSTLALHSAVALGLLLILIVLSFFNVVADCKYATAI